MTQSSFPPISDEMLSAYLDDELSAEQRQRVPAALAEDPQLQSTLGELEQIRRDLQTLPTYSLPSAFAQRIADAVRTEKLTSPARRLETTSWSRPRHARWIFAVAASAAVILIGLMLFPPRGHRQVASSRTSDMGKFNLPFEESLAELAPAPSDELAEEEAAVAADLADSAAPAQQTTELEDLRDTVPKRLSEGGQDVDAIVRVSLTKKRLAELERDTSTSPTPLAAGLDRQADADKNAFFLKQNDVRFLREPSGFDDWFAELGVQRPSRVLMIEGTASQVTRALQDLAGEQAETISVKDGVTARELALSETIRGKQPGTRPQEGIASDALSVPRLSLSAARGQLGGYAGQPATRESLSMQAPANGAAAAAILPSGTAPIADGTPAAEDANNVQAEARANAPATASRARFATKQEAEPQDRREEHEVAQDAESKRESAVPSKDEQPSTTAPRRFRVVLFVHEAPR